MYRHGCWPPSPPSTWQRWSSLPSPASLWLAFAMLWVRRIVATIGSPVETAWLNRNLDAASRATVISMTGQANSIGQAAGGPAFGLIANAVSIPAALLASAVVLSPTAALYHGLIARDRVPSNPFQPQPTETESCRQAADQRGAWTAAGLGARPLAVGNRHAALAP